jgi:arginyl-tRNA synthetase
VVGDALAALLAKVGFEVTKEYYINDAGGQVDTLARSAYLRYREALGEDIGEIPEGLYPGDYLKDVGKALAARDGDKWRQRTRNRLAAAGPRFTIDAMMDLVRPTWISSASTRRCSPRSARWSRPAASRRW